MNKIKKLTLLILIPTICLSILVIMNACEGDLPPVSEMEYYRESQLRNLMRNEILPLHEVFQTQTLALNNAINSYQILKNQEQLTEVRAQWIATAKAWRRCEIYNLGSISDKFLHNRINKWPIDANKIESNISSSSEINEAFLEAQGSNSIGLASLEYLLFDATSSVSEIQNVLSKDNKRLDYLVSLSTQLNTNATALLSEWKVYQPDFESAHDGGFDGSQNKVINALINHLEFVVYTKIGRPAGKNTGVVSSTSVEAYQSSESLHFINQNLTTIQRLYTGQFENTAFRIGFMEIMKVSGATQLDTDIQAQIKLCKQLVESINEPLSSAVINQPEAVSRLYNELINLLILFKVDMSNALGSTVTFTSNDGD